MFKIIGVRIHKDCAPNIRKVLKEESSYFIYNNYEDDYSNDQNSKSSKWIGIKHRNDATETVPPDDFYRLKDNKNGPVINISAIVGKNGSGKSSLIEIAIRIINNFAIEAGFIENQSSLIKVKGLKATLFYSIDKTIFYIECDGEICTWRKGNTIIDIQNTNAKRTLLSHSNEVFYTIITNYSMFAYNSLNFQNEDVGIQKDGESWIASLFHKNDSYQTPVVLNPKRTKGNFDVNKEKDLTTQRLLALFTDAGNEKLFMAQTALGYVFSLEKENKLLLHTIESFFKRTYQKKLFDTFDFNSYKKSSIMNYHYKLWSQIEQIIMGNKSLFVKSNNIIKDVSSTSKETDLIIYLKSFSDYIERVEDNGDDVCWGLELPDNSYDVYLLLRRLLDFIQQYCPLINLIQLQQLLMIIDIWDCWKKKRLIDYELKISDALKSQDPHHHAMLYLVYKTISIFETYHYYFNSALTENNVYLFDPSNEFYTNKNRLTEEFNKLYDSLNEEKSFETLKLRQTINYLLHNTTDTSDKQQLCGYDYYLSFVQLLQKTNEIKTKDSSLKTIELLPPPIFVGDILFSTNNTYNQFQNLNQEGLNKALKDKMDDVFTLKMKSSGELQLLFNIGTLIYHLRNINFSTNQNGNITYSNVSIILDEVELYFHPEYQRRYIDYLLESIAHAGLDRINNINICCVTHSPFILSDIPKGNILYLDEGEDVTQEKSLNTFGANINELLCHSFFLSDGFMGEFAKNRINSLVNYLNNEINEDNWDEKKALELIDIVGDEVIQYQLRQLYAKRFNNSDYYKDWVQREAKRLGIKQ